MRVSLGPVRPRDPHRDLFRDGTALVRRGDGALDKPREFSQVGIRMRRAGRKTTVPGCPRTASHSHPDLPNDRLLGPVDADAQAYTDASAVWRVPLHGGRFAEGAAVLR